MNSDNPVTTAQPPRAGNLHQWLAKWKRLLVIREFRHWLNMRWLNYSIATQVRSLRIQRGLSQQELADRVGLSIGTIIRIEQVYWRGVWPTINTLCKIAAGLDVALLARFTSWGELIQEIEAADLARPIPSFEEEVINGNF